MKVYQMIYVVTCQMAYDSEDYPSIDKIFSNEEDAIKYAQRKSSRVKDFCWEVKKYPLIKTKESAQEFIDKKNTTKKGMIYRMTVCPLIEDKKI
jgi:hypothetical protein